MGWDLGERRIKGDPNSAGYSELRAMCLPVCKVTTLHRERSHREHPSPQPLCLSHPPHKQADTQKHTLHSWLREIQSPPSSGRSPGGWGWGGGLALEAQLLVLGSNVVPEQLQGLLHGSLGVRTEVPGVLALKNLDDGVRDELQGGARGVQVTGLGQARSQLRLRAHPIFPFFPGHLLSTYYTLGTSEWSP